MDHTRRRHRVRLLRRRAGDDRGSVLAVARPRRAAAAAAAARPGRAAARRDAVLRLLGARCDRIVVVARLLRLLIQSCAATSRHDAYKSYMGKVGTIAQSSTAERHARSRPRSTTPGVKVTDIVSKLAASPSRSARTCGRAAPRSARQAAPRERRPDRGAAAARQRRPGPRRHVPRDGGLEGERRRGAARRRRPTGCSRAT